MKTPAVSSKAPWHGKKSYLGSAKHTSKAVEISKSFFDFGYFRSVFDTFREVDVRLTRPDGNIGKVYLPVIRPAQGPNFPCLNLL